MTDVEMSDRAPRVIDLPAREDIRRILIMKWSALGDIALASTVFDDIAAAFPGRDIDINTMPPWQSLFAEDPRFGKVLCIGRGPGKRSPGAIYRWLKAVAAGRYDLIIDFQANDRSRLYLRLLRLCGRGARHRMGAWPVAPYTVSAPAGRESTLEQLRDMLSAGGIPCRGERPHLYIPEQNRRRAARLKRDYGLRDGEFAVLLPGSQAGGFLKRWGVRNYAAVARRLRAHGIDKVVALGGPEEREECAAIAATGGDWLIDESANTLILDVIPFIEGARYVVANDTGLGHLAAATGVPMVVVCGPTNPVRVKPPGGNITAVQAALFCKSCYRKTCSHHACMTLVSPDRVFDELLRLSGEASESTAACEGFVRSY